jgi:4-amino-4-deoxychorismate lyase
MKEFLYTEDLEKGDFPYNRTLMFGEGLFSTFRYKNKMPGNFMSHLERLKDSARMLSIKHPGDIYIESVLERAIKNSPFENKDLIIKLLVLIEGDSSYSALAEKSKLLISIKEFSSINQPISLTLSKIPRFSSDTLIEHKTTNYFFNVREKRTAIATGFDDSILINEKGLITETTSGNLFWVKGDKVFTPHSRNGLLSGITRGYVIEKLKQNGIKVVEDDFEVGSILFPEAIFITNSVHTMIEVKNIGNMIQPTLTNKLFPKIRKLL